jgi:hypothetical protein
VVLRAVDANHSRPRFSDPNSHLSCIRVVASPIGTGHDFGGAVWRCHDLAWSWRKYTVE